VEEIEESGKRTNSPQIQLAYLINIDWLEREIDILGNELVRWKEKVEYLEGKLVFLTE